MSKFKIEKGISRVTRVKLQATIEESIAADLVLLSLLVEPLNRLFTNWFPFLLRRPYLLFGQSGVQEGVDDLIFMEVKEP